MEAQISTSFCISNLKGAQIKKHQPGNIEEELIFKFPAKMGAGENNSVLFSFANTGNARQPLEMTSINREFGCF